MDETMSWIKGNFMFKYVLRRILLLIPVMLIVSFIIFSIINLLPGDAARVAAGDGATQEEIQAIREMMGLDYPFFVRYFEWLTNFILHQHLGYSRMIGWPVLPILLSVLPTTLQIMLIATVVSVMIGVPVGIISAVKRYSIFDNVGMGFAIVGVSMPTFWQALLLHMFILHLIRTNRLSLELFAGRGDSSFFLLISAVMLGISASAIIARMTRSSMLEVIYQDYIRTARAFGRTEGGIILKHAFKNACIPIITSIGLNFSFILAGAVYSEIIFRLNGIGALLVGTIGNRDYVLLMGAVLIICLIFSVANLVIDILYAFIDPRIKTQYK